MTKTTNKTVLKRIAESKTRFLEALRSSLGVVSLACDKIGIARSTYYAWLEDDPEFAKEVEAITERQIDMVESKLLSNINGGDTTAIIFYLKTKGKHRGYAERTEITGKDGKDLFAQKTDQELDQMITQMSQKLLISRGED